MPAPDRAELLTCGALLLAYAALRIAAAWPLAFDLIDPEELLNLRLAWQLAEDQPVGALGQYWYTGAGGAVGAGPLVLSLLYVPLGQLVQLDFAATRAMALGWSLLGAGAFAGLGRQLLGRGGGAAALLAALALPPSWLAWTLTANGNYIEAAAMTLLGAWIVLGIAGPVRALLGGVVLGFSAWFCISAAGPAVLLALAAAWRLRAGTADARASDPQSPGAQRTLIALAAGLALGVVPFAIAFEPLSQTASPVGSDAVWSLIANTARHPASWPAVLASSLSGVPLLSYREVAAADWAPAWLVAAEPLAKAGLWAAFATAAAVALRRGGPRDLIALGVAVVVGIPVGLTLLGVGPAGGPVEPLYFYDGRRAALVLPVLALGPAAIGHGLWARGAAARCLVLVVAAAALLPSLLLLQASEAPARPFRPAQYLLCPAEQPVERDSVCVDPLWEDQVAVLEALVDRPDLAGVPRRLETLRGFAAVEREQNRCSLARSPGSGDGWFGAGASLGSGCPAQIESLCAGPGEPACREGARWAAGIAAP